MGTRGLAVPAIVERLSGPSYSGPGQVEGAGVAGRPTKSCVSLRAVDGELPLTDLHMEADRYQDSPALTIEEVCCDSGSGHDAPGRVRKLTVCSSPSVTWTPSAAAWRPGSGPVCPARKS